MAITDGSAPLLALALAAAAASRLRLEKSDESRLSAGFVPAVAAMDRADLAYLRTIEDTLPVESAVEVLRATAAFRNGVHRIRQRTRKQIAELYLRYDRSYGWFDPIDPYTPSATGLTHADGTRIATLADGARSEVDELRANANQSVAKQLKASHIEALTVAKRRRREGFETELKRALESSVPSDAALTPSQSSKTLYELAELADGWY